MSKKNSNQAVRATPNYTAVPTTFYLGGLDNYVRAHLKRSNSYFTSEGTSLDVADGAAALENSILDVAEALMLGDGIALTITGENAVLAYLVRMFGAHQTAELIRRHRIEFVGYGREPGTPLSSPPATYTDGTPVPPGNPIFATFQWAAAEPDVFPGQVIDPAIAAEKALKRFASQLKIMPREIRELTARAAKRTHIVPADRVPAIFQRLGDAYQADQLEPLGLSPRIARDTNTYHEVPLAHLAQRLFYTENLLDFELDQFQMPEQWDDLRQFVLEVTTGNQVLRSVDRVMEYRRAPDLRSLFRQGILRIADIPRLREHPATVAFRRWLWAQPDPTNGDAIAEDFVRELTDLDRSRAAAFIRDGFTTVMLALAQDVALEPAHLQFPVRAAVDAGVALSGCIASTVREKLKRRPPSAFFDHIIDPAIRRSSISRG